MTGRERGRQSHGERGIRSSWPARWITALAVRVGALAAAAVLLQMSGSAAWDAHVLGLRGEIRPATVLELTRTSWGKADQATLAIPEIGPAVRVTTPRKDLDIGDAVAVIVDPRAPRRAALAGDGWPWRRVLVPLCGLPVVALFAERYGRVPKTAVARSHPDDDRPGAPPPHND